MATGLIQVVDSCQCAFVNLMCWNAVCGVSPERRQVVPSAAEEMSRKRPPKSQTYVTRLKAHWYHSYANMRNPRAFLVA